MAVEGLRGGALAVTAQIDGGGVEIIHAVGQGEVHQAVDLLLVDMVLAVFSLDHRPAHAAVAERADARVVLQHRTFEFLVALEGGTGDLFGGFGCAGGNTERSGAQTCRFYKFSSVHRAYALVW